MRVGKHKPEKSHGVSARVLLPACLPSGGASGGAGGDAGGVAERKTGVAGKILLAKYFAGFYTLYQRVGVAHQDRATVS